MSHTWLAAEPEKETNSLAWKLFGKVISKISRKDHVENFSHSLILIHSFISAHSFHTHTHTPFLRKSSSTETHFLPLPPFPSPPYQACSPGLHHWWSKFSLLEATRKTSTHQPFCPSTPDRKIKTATQKIQGEPACSSLSLETETTCFWGSGHCHMHWGEQLPHQEVPWSQPVGGMEGGAVPETSLCTGQTVKTTQWPCGTTQNLTKYSTEMPISTPKISL